MDREELTMASVDLERKPCGQMDDHIQRLLTAYEVAQILNVSAAWVYDHADRKQPRIPIVRLGKAVRFRPADIHAFIEKMIHSAAR
jgi:excisionase family DNA binding protein